MNDLFALLSAINPMMSGQAMMGAGTNPEVWGPLLDQMGVPPPDSPEGLAALLGGSPDVGESLMAGGGSMGLAPPMGPAAPTPDQMAGVGGASMGVVDPMNPQLASASQPPPGSGALSPAPPGLAPPVMGGAAAAGGKPGGIGQPVPPKAADPKFSGGITGAAKPNELGAKVGAGGSPASALMMALLGGAGGQPNPLRVPPLPGMLRA